MNGTNGESGYPVLSKDELQKAFDDLAPSYGREIWLTNHILGVNRLRSKLLRQAGGRILDVACGTGENFPFFSPESDITAIDLSGGSSPAGGGPGIERRNPSYGCRVA